MKLLYITVLLSQITLSQEAWTDRSRILPDQLRNIPVGLLLFHTPNPNYPEINEVDNEANYKWVHDTCIIPMGSNLQIIGAGSFIWTTTKGWIPNMDFSKKAAKKAFEIRHKTMVKDSSYCFSNNTRYGNKLFAGDALWYVLAKDANGMLFKGVAVIETEAGLIESK